MILLDTNVVSELMRRSPSIEVVRWTAQHPGTRLAITSITQAEILYGIELLPDGPRRAALLSAAEAMFWEDFEGRIFGFDSEAAPVYARIAARRRALGAPISQADAQIAAIARTHGATLATRNIVDFTDCGIDLVNPWESQ